MYRRTYLDHLHTSPATAKYLLPPVLEVTALTCRRLETRLEVLHEYAVRLLKTGPSIG
jgi:hypothetical protein